jgi:hypothetical protein
MNLYEQLTQPQRDKIQAEVEKYPATGRLIMYSLEHNSMIATLTIREASDIHGIFYPFEPFTLSNLYNIFQ